MSELPSPSSSSLQHDTILGPQSKKMKIATESSSSTSSVDIVVKLEDRLGNILCCTVCLNLAENFVYQCVNGHLMCHRCLEHLLADARIKDETSTCPNCRVEISRNQVTRNLAVEKAIAELPATCTFCKSKYQRSSLRNHEDLLCSERIVTCEYQKLGCGWKGPFIEQAEHENKCTQPSCEGRQILPYLRRKFDTYDVAAASHNEMLNFMSSEKMLFNDIQLKPSRSDEYLHRLMYDASQFSAFGYNWTIRVNVNDMERNVHLRTERFMSYQLRLKTQPNAPFLVKFFLMKGPYNYKTINMDTVFYDYEFSEREMNSLYNKLPVTTTEGCNHLLSLRILDFRIFMAKVTG